MDETYVKVKGKWCYLYRAIDREGKLVDVRLSEKRDIGAAKAFFKKTLATAYAPPETVTTGGHDSYPRAVRETLGKSVLHRTSRYLNNRLEQNHRGIKGRYKGMRSFKNFASAQQFCDAFDGLRDDLRSRIRPYEVLSLSKQRSLYLEKDAILGCCRRWRAGTARGEG